jgi:hypothetical protein
MAQSPRATTIASAASRTQGHQFPRTGWPPSCRRPEKIPGSRSRRGNQQGGTMESPQHRAEGSPRTCLARRPSGRGVPCAVGSARARGQPVSSKKDGAEPKPGPNLGGRQKCNVRRRYGRCADNLGVAAGDHVAPSLGYPRRGRAHVRRSTHWGIQPQTLFRFWRIARPSCFL